MYAREQGLTVVRPMVEQGARVALVAVRDSRRFGLQVLLRADVAAAGAEKGRMSLPCGVVEKGDRAAFALERCHGLAGGEARRLIGYEMKPAHALGHWVAAARVLLTATGLLFAVKGRQRASAPQTLPSRKRRLCGQDAPALAAYLARQDLYHDISRLHFFSRWIDTRTGCAHTFFLVHVPNDVRVTGMLWRAPEKLLMSWRSQELHLDFASFASLRILTDFASCDALLSEYP